MARDKNVHDFVQKVLRRRMVRKKCIPIHEIKITLVRVRIAFRQLLDLFGGVKAQKLIQPALYRVISAISNWLVHLDLLELPPRILLITLMHLILLFELGNELK